MHGSLATLGGGGAANHHGLAQWLLDISDTSDHLCTVDYQPDLNYNGEDSFTYKAENPDWSYDCSYCSIVFTDIFGDDPLGYVHSEEVTVTITISSVNNVPIADSKSVTTDEDVPVAVTLTGTDVESSQLTFEIIDQPQYGTLSGTLPNMTYVPNQDSVLSDSFTYKVNDGVNSSGSVTVTITLNPINDIPVAQAGSDQSIDAGSVVQLDGSQSLDADGDTITYSWIQTSGYPVTLTADNIASPQFTAPSQGGQLTFMLSVNDGIATSSPNVVNIYVGESIPEPTIAPSPGSVTSISFNSLVALTWSSPSDDGGSEITDYLVEYSTADGEVWLVYDDGVSTMTSATVSGLSKRTGIRV